MGQKYDILDNILEVFYEFPDESFTVREISRKTNIPKSTVQDYLKELKKVNMIKENKSVDSVLFKQKKINYYIEKIVKSGLIEYLIEKLNPSCIIIFGSFRKGDSVKESDVDLFIESNKKGNLNLTKFEKKLKHDIQLFIEPDINKLQPRLFNNVINGIKLYGSFKIK